MLFLKESYVIYKKMTSKPIEILKLDISFKIYHRNIQSLATELFMVRSNLSIRIRNDIFKLRSIIYNLTL